MISGKITSSMKSIRGRMFGRKSSPLGLA